MSDSRETLYLIDGSAVFYRAYFALIRNPLINSKGENTSATYGFVNSLLKILNDEKPDYVAVAFDTKHPTFRHKRYPDYKATRTEMPEDLVEQLPRIRQACDVLNVATCELAGFEADDIMGTLAVKAAQEGFDVWLVSGDKDMFQLVSERIGVFYPNTGPRAGYTRMGREEVRAKFGVYPELVIDKLALMGDSSDNVPGIAGIGPKTADKLLAQFGSLDEIFSGADSIAAKGVREKVAVGGDAATLSRELVTIDKDVPVGLKLADLKRRDINYEATRELFLELEFPRLLKSLMPSESKPESAEPSDERESVSADYVAVTSLTQLKQVCKEMKVAGEITVDTETTSLDPLEAELVGVSLCTSPGKAYYLPLAHSGEGAKNLPFDSAVAELKRLLENHKVQKSGQNLKYDLHVLRSAGIEIEPISFDTMLASYVLDPSARQHSLDFLAMKHFDYQMQPISDLIGKGRQQTTFDTVPIQKATHYAAEDADYTYRLRAIQSQRIHELELDNLYYNVELPLVKVLASMEADGIRVDSRMLGKLSKSMETGPVELQMQIYKIAGGEFNINSTRQLSHILFEKLGLPTGRKTTKKTGYSTDVRVLENLAKQHEFPQLILDYRQLAKLKSTYVDAIPRLVNKETGRVHTSFNQTVAATGRLSSTDPNLQNIPVRTEDGRQIRKAFVPRDKDHLLLVADYSQIELRVLAHYSDDPGLIQAFANAEDIHSRTAAEVYGVDLDDITPEMRRAAKTANFAVVYGVSAYGLSQQSELGLDESKQFIDTYFERYPGIANYMETTRQFARDNGYVTTLFGRRRYLPDISARNNNVRQFAERVAINTPIQGTAAEMIKKAMIKIHERMKSLRSTMVLQVHDELVFDCHRDEFEEVQSLVKKLMEKAVKLKVPVVVDVGVGENWLDAK